MNISDKTLVQIEEKPVRRGRKFDKWEHIPRICSVVQFHWGRQKLTQICYFFLLFFLLYFWQHKAPSPLAMASWAILRACTQLEKSAHSPILHVGSRPSGMRELACRWRAIHWGCTSFYMSGSYYHASKYLDYETSQFKSFKIGGKCYKRSSTW